MKQYFLPITITFLMVMLGIGIQTHLIFNLDVSWLMHVGEKMLAGGSYANDFFEVNPPMSIFLYLPAVLLSKFLQVNFITSSLIYTYTFLILSLVCCYLLLLKLLEPNTRLVNILIFAIAFAYLFLPATQLGQREHFMVMLIMPYVLLLALRLANKRINNFWAFLLGVFAGLGFSIKPFFFLAWLVLESYYSVTKKQFFAWIRIETLAIFLVVVSYLIAILTVTPDYLSKVLPFIWKFYYASFSSDFSLVAMLPLPYFIGLVVIGYLFIRSDLTYKNLADLLQLTTIVMLIIYVIQRTNWYYHILPSVIFLTVFLVLVCYESLSSGLTITHRQLIILSNRHSLRAYLLIALLVVPIVCAYREIDLAYTITNSPKGQKFIDHIKKLAYNDYIYNISDLMSPTFPLVDYSHVKPASRFPSLWMLLAIESLQKKASSATQQAMILNAKKMVLNAAIEDILRYNPKVILLELHSPNWDRLNLQIDFLKLFSADSRFPKIWQRYHYVETLGCYEIYQRN